MQNVVLCKARENLDLYEVNVLFIDAVTMKKWHERAQEQEKDFFFNSPAPTLHVGVKATCLVRDVTLVRLLGRLSTDISDLNRKTLSVQRVQLPFALSPIFINHFKYFIRKLESTVSSVMSHVSPANFQALDQRVSRKIRISSWFDRQRHMAKTQMASSYFPNFS